MIFLKNILNKLHDLLELTIIGYIIRKLQQLLSNDLRELHRVNLDNISKYFKKDKNKINTKVVFFNGTVYSPTMNLLPAFLSTIIFYNKSPESILIQKHNEPVLKKIYLSFDIKKYYILYSLIDIKSVISALYWSLKNFVLNLNVVSKFEPPSCIVNDIELGEYIYDEFLRSQKIGTLDKVNFKYLLFMYRGVYAYFRFVKLLKEIKPSYLVSSEISYLHSIFMKASLSLEKKPIVYVAVNYLSYDRFCISKVNLYKDISFKNITVFTTDMYKKVIQHYKKDILINFYNQKYASDTTGNMLSLIDDKKYDNNIIINNNLFINKYKFNNNYKNIFVYAHALVDGIRSYENIIFKDYYVWLEETLEILTKVLNINIFVKQHPNEERYQCKHRTNDILVKFNNIHIISYKLEDSILSEYADVIITSTGTIGIEAPCLGIPVITAAKPPYAGLETITVCKSYNEYKNTLYNISNIEKLDDETIERAKIQFLYYKLFQFVRLPFKDRELSAKIPMLHGNYKQYNALNELFLSVESIENSELFNSFEKMKEHNFDSCVNFSLMIE